MYSRKLFVVLLLAWSASGCMFHGDTPIAQAPLSFSVDNSANPVKNLSENPWWHEIGSRELNNLVTEALENNKQVSIASKNIEIAQASLDTVRLGWLPTFNLMSGQLNSNGIAILPNSPVPLIGSTGFFAFIPTWIVNIIQLPNQTKQSEKQVEVTAAEYLALRSAIASQTVSSYALLLATIEEEVILNALSENLNVRIKTARSMTSQGLDTQVAIAEQETQLNKIKVQFATNRSNQISAKNALLTLIGRQLAGFTPVEKFSSLNLDYITPGNTPMSVLATRPDVVAARAKIQAADYNISATASTLAPTPALEFARITAGGNSNGTQDAMYESMTLGLLAWTLNPQVIGQISSANKQYDKAVIHYMNVVDNAVKEVDNALADFEAKQKTLLNQEIILATSNKNLGTFKAMLKNGLLSETQYLQSTGQLDQANIAIVQTKLQTITSLTKLYQSMGGGATYNLKDYSLKDQSIVGNDRVDTKN